MTTSGWHRKRSGTAAQQARDARYRTSDYRAAERALRALVEAGMGFCWRCQGWIDPSLRVRRGSRVLRAWHVGHDDSGLQIMGPEHDRCNLVAAAVKGARIRNRARATTSVRL